MSELCLEAAPAETLLEALAKRGLCPEGGCRGTGRCGRCRVRYSEGAPLPDALERRYFSPEELRGGVRLACLHRVTAPCRVTAEFVPAGRTEVVTQTAFLPETAPEGAEAGPWRIAVDLGTTTVAMQARREADGGVLAEWKGLNPQRRFGDDVVSRMQEALSGRAGQLQQCAQAALAEGIESLIAAVGGRSGPQAADALAGICLAGNTVMEHLLAGLPTEGLSRYPFEPVTLEEQKIRIPAGPGRAADGCPGGNGGDPGYELTLLPGISAFVGADILAGILAGGLHRREEISLLIDLGTNGELVLGNRDRLLCTATAAGPAFEGRSGAEGTDLIAVIGELLDAGIVDESGLLAEPWFGDGIDWTPAGRPDRRIHIGQEDIRALQMAKAAVFAGIRVLLRLYGIGPEAVSRVLLAGGFGYFLDVDRAVRIGLLPASLAGRTRAVGNASLAGAFLYAERGCREEADRIRRICEPVNLAEQQEFGALYLSHLDFAEEE